MPYTKVKADISQIIERSRFGDEAFFTDSRKAAESVIEYLQREDLLSKAGVVKLSDYLAFLEAAKQA